MFSEKLSKIFSDLALRSLAQRVERLRNLNPDKFYVENVRVVMDTSTHAARTLCERGVQEGLFDKHVEALDPITGQTIATANSEGELELEIIIEPGLDNEDDEPRKIPASSLQKLTYYSMHQE